MPRIRRDLLELVEVVIPEAIEVGKHYIVKLKIKNIATFWPTVYRYNYTVEGDEEKVEGTRDTIIKAGEEKEIEIEREAKNGVEHWEVEVFRGITPKNTMTDPQFTEEFDVPKEVPPPGIEVKTFEIIDPTEKEIYAGGEFTGKTTIRNKTTEHLSIEEVKVKITQNSKSLDSVMFTDVELDPGEELSKEQVFSENVGIAGDYEVCAAV